MLLHYKKAQKTELFKRKNENAIRIKEKLYREREREVIGEDRGQHGSEDWWRQKHQINKRSGINFRFFFIMERNKN